jgi:hypothetical protein
MVRRFGADPLALLPRSLPDARWRTCARAGPPSASRSCKGAVLDGRAAPSKKLTGLANMDPFPANFGVGNRAGNCHFSFSYFCYILEI